MSPTEKGDLVYLLNILQYIGKIWKYAENINDANDFLMHEDQIAFNAALTMFSNIGENVKKIKESTKVEYSYINWKMYKDFRNHVVHEYTGVDHEIVYNVITNDLSILKQNIEQIIIDRLNKGTFEMEVINISRNSLHYNFVDFKNFIGS